MLVVSASSIILLKLGLAVDFDRFYLRKKDIVSLNFEVLAKGA